MLLLVRHEPLAVEGALVDEVGVGHAHLLKEGVPAKWRQGLLKPRESTVCIPPVDPFTDLRAPLGTPQPPVPNVSTRVRCA